VQEFINKLREQRMAVINLSYFKAYAKTMFLILNHFQSVDIAPPSWLCFSF